jgi:hypothetical protein
MCALRIDVGAGTTLEVTAIAGDTHPAPEGSMRHPMFALFLSSALAACAGQGGSNDPVDDGSGDDGGGDDGSGDGEWEEPERPAECPSGEMGVAALIDPEAYDEAAGDSDTGPPRVRYLWGGINDTTDFEIDLYDGYGIFKDTPSAPGTFTIQGEDADPIDCGLCVYVNFWTDDWYWPLQATGGTVTIEEVNGKLKGTASGLTFKELSDTGEGYMESSDGGCGATIESVPFDTSYTAE